jgi:hypothetical protein
MSSVPFYETVMGFKVIRRAEAQVCCVARDEIQIALAENGGDPTQEGCFLPG